MIKLFWPKLCSNGSRRGCLQGICHFGAETDLFNFQCSQVVTHGHRGISPLVPQKSFHGETPGVGGGDFAYERGGETRRKF